MHFSEKEIDKICEITVNAGLITLKYHKKDVSYNKKEDNSKITIADIEAHNYIFSSLKEIFPEISIVSEESSEEENNSALENDTYFLIDPLDGTSNFVKGGDNYTINIALIINQKPILGFIYVPKKDILYFTKNNKSYKKHQDKIMQIKVSTSKKNLVAITTQRKDEKEEVENWIKEKNLEIAEIINISSSYKFCLIAEGSADIYPRMIHIKSWDIAAGHALINNSGGKVLNQENMQEVIYEKNLKAPKFIAINSDIVLNKLK